MAGGTLRETGEERVVEGDQVKTNRVTYATKYRHYYGE
jgi:hypothetical protein